MDAKQVYDQAMAILVEEFGEENAAQIVVEVSNHFGGHRKKSEFSITVWRGETIVWGEYLASNPINFLRAGIAKIRKAFGFINYDPILLGM